MRSLLAQRLSPLAVTSIKQSIPPLSNFAPQQQRRTLSSTRMSIEKAKEVFFNAENYAVVGAS